ncbi:MAG TPA: hypothetical protein VK158_04950 [Acidobacteriota bacterium]|nr:hypothetical protein [Acidobacteriota bacterium]
MWLSVIRKTFLARADVVDIGMSIFGVAIQGLVALFFGLYLNSPQVFWYYLFTIGIMNSFNRRNPFREFEDLVVEGRIANYLIRPFNLISYVCVRNFADALWSLIGISATLFLAYTILVGMPEFTVAILTRFLIASIVTIIFFYFTIAIFLIMAIRTERIVSFTRIYFMIGFFLGGGFFPFAIHNVITYLPQYYLFGGPATFVTTGVITHPYLWLTYLILFPIIAALLYKWIIRYLEVNGG